MHILCVPHLDMNGKLWVGPSDLRLHRLLGDSDKWRKADYWQVAPESTPEAATLMDAGFYLPG